MSKEIWNLGRVCGFSAYELYLRYIALEAPGVTPATEKEWLSSMLTMGNSMLLRIGTDSVSGVHYRDIALPANSKICAANTIFASYFAGSGATSSDSADYTGFATRVTDYGPLIYNTSESHPSGSTVPPTSTNVGDLTEDMKAQIPEYLKIIDGIVIQPGTWSESALKPPYCDFKPDLTEVPTIRISFSDRVNTPFFILLTGFSNKFVVQGVSGTDTATGSQSPDDGDFLGPWVFPWASKILFSVPPAFMDFAASGGYTRKLPSTETTVAVENASIIDMAAANPSTYYVYYYNNPDPSVTCEITAIAYTNTSGSVIATYQQNSAVAPSIYGMRIDSGVAAGYKFYPLDVAAPGTVKIFEGDMAIISAEAVNEYLPHNIGMFRDTDLVIYEIDNRMAVGTEGRYIPVSEDRTENLAALYMYNTRYLWFYADYQVPTQFSLEDIKHLNGIKAISGYVSAAFISKFCVDYDTAIAACAVNHICDGYQIQKGYIDQIVAKYGAAIARSDFGYFFQMNQPYMNAQPGQEGMFIPVHLRTRRICVGLSGAKIINISHGFNFSDHTVSVTSGNTGVTLNRASTDLMGSYWDHADGKVETDQTGVYVFEDHPILNEVVTEYEAYWKPQACVPKSPVSPVNYNDQFVQWFSELLLTDIYSTTELEAIGVHSDYFNLSFQKFLEYAGTLRDMSLPISSVTADTTPYEENLFIFTKTAIAQIADVNFEWGSDSFTAQLLARALMSKLDFYRMSEVKFYTFTGTANPVTIQSDETDVYTDTAFRTWAAVGYSGNHQTKSISLVDDIGSPLPTGGTGGNIDTDRIRWNDLLDGLNQNKAIDILGEALRTIRNSGDNYIQLANIRLYISATEPTGTIPDGSIGIVWGAGVYKHSSGAWAALA